MEAAGHRRVVAAEVLEFVTAGEVPRRQGLEPHEEAPQAGLRGPHDQVAAQNRIDGRRALKQTVHPAHTLEQRGGKARIAEQMVVEEIEMTSGQA